MRTLGWLIALLVNLFVVAAFAPSMLEGDIVGFVASALFATISALLIATRDQRLPSWGHTAMKVLCCAVPVLALAGALDYGRVSGLEMLSLIFAVLVGLGSRRALLLFAPRPNVAVNRDAPTAARPLP